jgi:hypothetical protein
MNIPGRAAAEIRLAVGGAPVSVVITCRRGRGAMTMTVFSHVLRPAGSASGVLVVALTR